MSEPIDPPDIHTQLRFRAEARLQSGTTPSTSHWSMGVDALRLLHRLSSNPDNAEDALKLLHELQVHQVEIDLQNEEIAANERALEEDLRRYQTLYDYAPVAYFIVSLEGVIVQGNHAAAGLLGVAQEDLAGQPIDTLVDPQGRPALSCLLKRVAHSGDRDCCLAQAGGGANGSRHLQISASVPPGREHILLTCCECVSAQ